MSLHDPPILDVLIIGAGQAGMAAAHRLYNSANNMKIHVVEAHSHVGGRTRNVDVVTGQYDQATEHAVELGGTWLSPNHTAFLGLCEDMQIPFYRSSFIPENNVTNDNVTNVTTTDTHINDIQEEDDWPWWYWGPDYADEEMAQQSDIILFAHGKKTKFRTHQQFLGAFMEEEDGDTNSTLQDLQTVGDVIWKESLDQQVPDLSWDTLQPGPHWNELDQYTTAAKLMPLLSSIDARNILRQVIHTKNAQEPNNVGYLYNLISFKGCNSDGPDGEYRIQGGTQAVPLEIAKLIGAERITLGDPVRSIQSQQQQPTTTTTNSSSTSVIQVTTQSGKVFHAKYLIVTGSPPAIMGMQFDNPPWPGEQAQLFQRMPMGTTRKVMAIYKQGPWWRKLGLTGDILASQLPPSLSVPVDSNNSTDRQPLFSLSYDTSPYSRQYGVITCFVEGLANLYYSGLSKDDQEQLFRDFLKLAFADYLPSSSSSDDQKWNPDEILMHNWADDPFVRGAYTGFFGPGVLSEPAWWNAYRQMEKIPHVYVAGADYHVGYGNGYIEGAVRSGQRAADLIIQEQMRSKESSGVGTTKASS